MSTFPAPLKSISSKIESSKPVEIETTSGTPSDEGKLFDIPSGTAVNSGRCNIDKVLQEYTEGMDQGERLAVLGKSIKFIVEKDYEERLTSRVRPKSMWPGLYVS